MLNPVTPRAIRFARYRVTFSPRRGFPGHECYGPMFRGALGHAFALMDERDGTNLREEFHSGEGDSDIRPYRVVSVYPGEVNGPLGLIHLTFDLFGTANDRLRDWAEAWRVAGEELGFGTHRDRMRLLAFERLTEGRLVEPTEHPSSLPIILFDTPTSVKEDGRAVFPNLTALLQTALRRLEGLNRYEPDGPELAPVVASDEGLFVNDDRKRMETFSRVSMQSGSTELRGMVGYWRLLGNLSRDNALLLQFAERFGVGRGVVFGMGRIVLLYQAIDLRQLGRFHPPAVAGKEISTEVERKPRRSRSSVLRHPKP